LFTKIRAESPSPKARQRPLHRGYFRHVVYFIRTLKTLPECEYEGRFFRDGDQKWDFGRSETMNAPTEKRYGIHSYYPSSFLWDFVQRRNYNGFLNGSFRRGLDITY
jgi:hypothetical protein